MDNHGAESEITTLASERNINRGNRIREKVDGEDTINE